MSLERPASLASARLQMTAIRTVERDGLPRLAATMGPEDGEVSRPVCYRGRGDAPRAAVKMNRDAKVRRTTAQRTAQSDQATADR
jgi:hypothetical protein